MSKVTPRELGGHKRHIELEGGVNLRDLGGYQSKNGQRVKWRTLLRSGHLKDITIADRAQLKSFDLRAIHDFRRSPEIEKYPSSTGNIQIISNYELGVGSMGQFMQHFESGDLSPQDAHEFVVSAYRDCALDVASAFKLFFRHMLDQKDGAILFHCMAGKDRTGIAAALILHILEVPYETIQSDYMLTAHYLPVDDIIENFIQSKRELSTLIDGNRETIAPYCGVHADNLEAFFAGVKATHGSIDVYISDALGLSPNDIAELRQRYLV